MGFIRKNLFILLATLVGLSVFLLFVNIYFPDFHFSFSDESVLILFPFVLLIVGFILLALKKEGQQITPIQSKIFPVARIVFWCVSGILGLLVLIISLLFFQGMVASWSIL